MKTVKKYKISRRLKTPLFEKCQTQKFVLREQRKQTTGRRTRPASEYGKQLTEKQKLRYLYGVSERVLKNYVKHAIAVRGTDSQEVLEESLERRLDNVVYQLGLAPTRRMARQLVSHGHFTINGRRVTVPSYRVDNDNKVGIREGSLRTFLFKSLFDGGTVKPRTDWVSWDSKTRQGGISGKPVIEGSIFSLPVIFEYYSR